jgi:hypothetical protein
MIEVSQFFPRKDKVSVAKFWGGSNIVADFLKLLDENRSLKDIHLFWKSVLTSWNLYIMLDILIRTVDNDN